MWDESKEASMPRTDSIHSAVSTELRLATDIDADIDAGGS